MSQQQTVQDQITFSSDHPSLAGHFPGQPVVPGVVLLDMLRQKLLQWKQASGISGSVVQFKSVKFLSPVTLSDRVEKTLDVLFTEAGNSCDSGIEADALKIDFRCLYESVTVLQGQCILSLADPD